MSVPIPSIFDHLAALSDATRSRLLLALERHEMAVSELCAVVQLPQSTVSRHLKVLADEGWVTSRAEGTSRRYRMLAERLNPVSAGLWQVVREQVAGSTAAAEDARRIRSVLAQRRSRSQEFFSSAAGEWDALRRGMFGERTDLHALLGLLDGTWTVGDLGCGTGTIAEVLAPFVGQVVAVDDSPAMLEAARARLDGLSNVEVRSGGLEALPIDTASLDAAILFLVLHHLAEPREAVAEVGRVLRPGGRLLIADMTPHEREEYRQQMGHVWLGFSPRQVEKWMDAGTWEKFRYRVLPADPGAKGPTLFAASMKKCQSA